MKRVISFVLALVLMVSVFPTGLLGIPMEVSAAETRKTALRIITQPKSVAVETGKTVKFTIKASGDGLKYHWCWGPNNGTEWIDLYEYTNTVSFKMSAEFDGYVFACLVEDKYGNYVQSNTATLTLKRVAKIKTQPKSVVVSEGKAAKTTVKATGDGLKYTWYFANKGASKWTKSSVESATYAIKMTSSVNGRRVYCVVKDKYGNTVKSKIATLSMKKALKIATQPKSVTVANGKAATTTVKATGEGLKYTWYFANKGASKWTKSSVKSATYAIKMTASVNGRRIYCVVKDKYGESVKSKVVTLSMKNAVKITTQPKSVMVANGKAAKTTVKATGVGLKYTWYFANKGATKWTKSSVTSATYAIKMTSAIDGRRVYCVVKDKYGNTVKTKVATLSLVGDFKAVAGEWLCTSYVTAGGDILWEGQPDGYMKISSNGSVYMLDSDVEYSYNLESAGKTTYKYYYRIRTKKSTINITYYLTSDMIEFEVDGDRRYYERAALYW